jgi:hypothetical protein
MIRDVIQRFSYRFRLWRREQLEDYAISIPRADTDKPDYLSYYIEHPKYMELVTESTLKSIGRIFGAYFGVLILASQLCFFIARSVPATRLVLGVVFVAFTGLWTLSTIFGEVRLRKARRQYREQQAIKSSNQALQLTADRRDEPVSIHEPPFDPSFPRFRQR